MSGITCYSSQWDVHWAGRCRKPAHMWRDTTRAILGFVLSVVVSNCNPEDNFYALQRKALFGLMAALQEQFLISDENVKGHKDWGVNKACPVLKIKA